MKVVIDISPLKSAHKTRGIGTYTRNLAESLIQIDPKNDYILTSKPNHLATDLIHYPYFDFFFPTLPFKKTKPTIVTIHDTIPLIFPQHYKPGLKGKINLIRQKLALQSADAIITDSNNSKKDIAHYLNQPNQKIHVVHLAANRQFKKASQAEIKRVRKKYHLPAKFVLYVGDINYNKNLKALINAFSKTNSKFHLVFVTRALRNKHLPEAKIIFQSLKQYNLKERFHLLTNVPLDPSSDLIAIYSTATAYVQPSLYEGFGLPVLEALKCQTLVISSNAASLPEVGGDAVIYFDPKNINSLTSALTKTLNLSYPKRQRLIAEGLKQANKFSWDETAKNTIKIYQQIIN